MLAIIVFLIFILLPAGWYLRDWKFNDKRTIEYRRITKGLLALWIILGSFSTFFYGKQNVENVALQNKINDLVAGKNQLLLSTSDLSKQIANYQKEIATKDARIVELERQARIIRTIDGKIECVFSGNWAREKHPGDRLPGSWNKAQAYARIFQNDANDSTAILFLLDNVKMTKLPDGNLKVNLEVRATPGTGPLGQELDYLKKYAHLLVYIPFVYREDAIDNKMTLQRLSASFFVNGAEKSQIIQSDHFEVPIPEGGKSAGLQLNKKGLLDARSGGDDH